MNDEPTMPRRAASATRTLRAGAVLGRYVVVRFIGAGGNGEVYAAYDQVLRRTVALKILRGAEAGDGGWHTLLDEAQSLARLSHPNVVSVHDVGQHDGIVFISMELIDGVDLGRFIADDARSRPARMAVLLGAGHGLLAAHDAGVVHGDFKPANVLVGDDGRARVVDFGLAQVEASAAAGGTQGYAAPEQRTSAAADQYSFAIVAVQVLTGGNDPARLPSRLRPLLTRALHTDPAQRWPSLSVLLPAMQRRSRPRRTVLPVSAVALAGVGIAAWLGSEGEPPSRCAGVEQALDGVWDAARRGSLRTAFAAVDQPWGPHVGDATEARLDDYARGWMQARLALCEQGDTPAYALRRVCLDANRAALDTAADVVLEADTADLQRALDVVGSLPDVTHCLDVEVRTPRATTPTPQALPEIAEIQAELARMKVLRAAGRYADAVPRARDLAARALAVGDEHDAAMAKLELGDLQSRTGDDAAVETLHEALTLALASGRQDVAAKAAARLARRAAEASAFDDARRWLNHADAAARAVGSPPELVASVESARSHVLGATGDARGEVDAARRMLAAIEAGSARPERMAVALNTLAISLYRLGDTQEAAEHAQRALALAQTHLSNQHPSWSLYALTLAGIRTEEGRHDEATELLKAAHSVSARSRGATHATTLTIASGLATARAYAGDYAEAARLQRDVLAAKIQSSGPRSLSTATSRLNLGIALHRLGQRQDAEPELAQAHAIFAEHLGAEHPHVILSRAHLADVRVDLGQREQMRAELKAIIADADGSAAAIAQFALARALDDTPQSLRLARAAREHYASHPGYSTALGQVDAFIAEHS